MWQHGYGGHTTYYQVVVVVVVVVVVTKAATTATAVLWVRLGLCIMVWGWVVMRLGKKGGRHTGWFVE
jgi:hypothetical protein